MGRAVDWPLVYTVAAFLLGSVAASLTAVVGLLLGVPRSRPWLLLYFLWIAIDESPKRGGYDFCWRWGLTAWVRRGWWWREAMAYYPIQTHRTAPLPPEKGPYLFCNHPHGIIGVGTSGVFGTAAYQAACPGLEPLHLLGLHRLFQVPFFREWVLLHGHASADKSAMLRLLGRGHHLALNIGGAREALDARPGTLRLVLKKRQGFVRIALQAGAALVPVIHFGENDLYDNVSGEKGSRLRWLQDFLQQTFGFALPLFRGHSWLPLLPKQRPVDCVIGAPIYVGEKTANPTP